VLLIEDDVRLAREVAWFLGRNGLEVNTLHRGELAVSAANDVDIVVLDWMLPGLDGLSVCRAIRAAHPLPILMLTARDGDASEVRALEEGADDYLSKPVRPGVLLARIRALLRRASSPSDAGPAGTLRVGALELDDQRREVFHAGVELTLTDAEYALLHLLAVQAGTVVSRDALSMALSGRPHDGLDRSVDQYICRLRRKLGDRGRAPRVLKTVRGEGYLLAGTVQR
jgi:two-component system response regulator RstA